ncbi:hypothetical protein EG346_11050 [Chryseobacterium carnipullorum]|uniref:YD repeat-containing protein n=1 Tax=Chryseobacterium carnipullorum TaxID=1124835 RepID=A0A376DP71_CHRCU|nr:hypothetical protein [Chryseobacterium carnipullorum]AZA48685.1 hypothetical protein EG346_11050 [Chryseobacterium carnipullorum]AZA63599.1 hypothetical protein EG345_01950 [Chryseobacterium carnipullorum]STC92919.1 Uncharacterised protein [Chryseobacterium carnipullorum]
MKKTLTLVGIILSALMYSQSNTPQDYTTNTNDAGKHIPKISPTSPESFKFSQYGNVPIGMFTGAPNINIPITELSVDGTSIPISLNYASNGINVDEMNGSVGLGWTFISGGIITKTIRDRPDEESSFGSGDVPLAENFATQLSAYLNFCENDDFDSEPDLYSANFGGYNVKFMINKAGNIIMIDQKDYKIKRNDNGNLFSIILDNGVRYNFNTIEYIQNRTFNTGGHQPPQQYIQSWYLTSIITSNGQTLTFEYQDVSYTTILSQSQTMTYTQTIQQKYGDLQYDDLNDFYYCEGKPYTIPPDLGLIADSEQYVVGKQLKKIFDTNNNSVVFSYSSQNGDYSILTNVKKYHTNIVIDDISFNYLTTNSSRVFLTEMLNNKINSSHKFTYNNPQSFPPRLSFSRDMWGFYNGVSNSSLVPQLFSSNDTTAPQYSGANQKVEPSYGQYGLLKAITYPTGGNTLFNYENHVRKENVLVYAPEVFLGTSTVNNSNTYDSTQELTITPAKSGYVRIQLSNYLNPYGNCKDSPDLETDKQKGGMWVKDQLGNYLPLFEYFPGIGYTSLGISAESSLNNSQTAYVFVEKNQTIKVTVQASFVCCQAYIQVYYYDQEDKSVLQDVLLGGYRVSSTVDTPGDGLPVIRKYKYIKDNGEHSINVTRDPVFVEVRSAGSLCMGSLNPLPIMSVYTAITSSNIGRLFSFNPNIFYDTVEEQIEGKGKTVHHFSSEKDYPGTTLKGSSIISAPWTNSGWNNGKEILTVYKDNNNTTLKTIENNYVEDQSRTSYLGGISRRKIYEPIINVGNWDADYPHMDVVYYKNISRFTYLQSQKTSDYLNGVPIVTQTEYFYNNPWHYQLNKQKITFPDASIDETNYSYAHEKGNQLMIDKNMVGIPLETSTNQTIGTSTKTLSKSETVYPKTAAEITNNNASLVLPLYVKSYDISDLTGVPSTEVTYDKYDSKGNLQQYTTKNGISATIIWGYNQTQPIAKIEGAKLSDIPQALIDNIVNASVNDGQLSTEASEQSLISALDVFRNNAALSAYQISTYSYDPLIGVKSITPPSGIREFYIYDTANRLKEVRENSPTGKILKEYKYNYKN